MSNPVPNHVLASVLKKYGQYMLLKIHVENNQSLLTDKYVEAIDSHNKRMEMNQYLDAGFDLFTPNDITQNNTKINFQVKTAAIMFHDLGRNHPTGFYLYPRSSISKTSLRLANSVGIIDAGYRGNLIGCFDNISPSMDDTVQVTQYTKIAQICAPSLVPIFVQLVNNIDDLGQTERGEGGFGSTGL